MNRMKLEIFDGRWKLVGTYDKKYLLENVFNGNQLIITHKQLERIRNGNDSVSKIISRRINVETPYVTNSVVEKYQRQKLRHARG